MSKTDLKNGVNSLPATSTRFHGVWPVMLTPFDARLNIDWDAYDRLVEWYIDSGVSGLFACCQSSEMFMLSAEERFALTERAMRRANGRVPVVAGVLEADMEPESTSRLKDTGVQALILLTNQIAHPDTDEGGVWKNIEHLLASIEGIDFGIYECPYPNNRLLSPNLVGKLAASGRFVFYKETSCLPDVLRAKLAACSDSRLGLLMANNPTLLEGLRDGVDGYCGVMANFFPRLLVHLCDTWKSEAEETERLGAFIGAVSLIEKYFYPGNAKYFLRAILGESIYCRKMDIGQLPMDSRLALDQLSALISREESSLSTARPIGNQNHV